MTSIVAESDHRGGSLRRAHFDWSAERPSVVTPYVLSAGVGVAVIARTLLAGRTGPSSLPAATLFSVFLGILASAAGWRPGRLRISRVLLGLAGGAVLVAGPLLVHGTAVAMGGAGAARMAGWSVVVSSVALAEEVFFRGVLWKAISRERGQLAALVATSVVFAVIHVPLYGLAAVPLDMGVGLGLGALRLWSGGVAAPAVAHLVADLAGGWL